MKIKTLYRDADHQQWMATYCNSDGVEVGEPTPIDLMGLTFNQFISDYLYQD